MAQSSIECLAERVRMISEEFYWELFEDVQHAKIMHKEEMIDFAYDCRNLMAADELAIAHWYDKTFNTK